MPFYKFGRNDVIRNVVRAYPYNEFYVYNGQIYYNNTPNLQGEFHEKHLHVDTGYISLHEINVDQDTLIYPFVVKNGTLNAFKTVSTNSFNTDNEYGDEMQGTYPLSASISRSYFSEGQSRTQMRALKNTLDFYTHHSIHFSASYTGDTDIVGGWDKYEQELGLISVPSIFYGSHIKKGTMELNFYVTGSLIGTLRDEKENGELIQTGPTGSNGSGSVAGVVLYGEGFLVLTGSWDLSNGDHQEGYEGTAESPSWVHFGAGADDGQMTGTTHTASSFQMSFNGMTQTPSVMMLAHAKQGALNYSNNPTYVQHGQMTGSDQDQTGYKEREEIKLYNHVSGAHSDTTPDFDHQVYISKVGIYDEHKNLIAIAKLATPVKKTEQRDLTFKLKLDL